MFIQVMGDDRQVTIEREFFIDNLLVQIRFIIVMIRWTGLAPWEFEFPFPGSLISTFLRQVASLFWNTAHCEEAVQGYLAHKKHPLP